MTTNNNNNNNKTTTSKSSSTSKKPDSKPSKPESSTKTSTKKSDQTTKNKSDETSKKSDRTTKVKSDESSKKKNKSDESSKKSDKSSDKKKPSSSSDKAKDKSVPSKSNVKSTSKTDDNKVMMNSCMGRCKLVKINKDPSKKKTHPSHPQHGLEKTSSKYSYNCDGCKMQGVGERYKCKPCKFNLHVDCTSTKSTIKFQGYKCKFLERPHDLRTSCGACATPVEGFVYHCEENNTYFHPSCAKLKNKIDIQDVIFRLDKQVSNKCLRCQKRNLQGTSKNIRGWSYVSNYNDFTLHVYCLIEMAMQLSSVTSKKKNGASSSINIPLTTIFKGTNKTTTTTTGGSDNKFWIKTLELFLKLVLPSLLGAPPATIVLSLAAAGVKGLVDLLL